MIDDAITAKQIARMGGLDFFPKDPAAIRELKSAASVARTPAILEQVVTDWICEQRECAKPADLRRLIHSANGEIKTASQGCPDCDGAGWQTHWYAFDDKTHPSQRQKPVRLCREQEATYDRAQRIAVERGFENRTVSTQATPCKCRVLVAAVSR